MFSHNKSKDNDKKYTNVNPQQLASLPRDMQVEIIKNLSLKDITKLAQTSKYFRTLAIKNNLEYAAIVRGQAILKSAEFKLLPTDIKKRLDNQYGFLALGSTPPLITIAQVQEFDAINCGCLTAILSYNGLEALRGGLITVDQAIAFGAIRIQNLQAILTDNGLIAITEGLINVEQAQRFDAIAGVNILRALLTPNGLTAMREGLIDVGMLLDNQTLAQVPILTASLTDDGLAQLRVAPIQHRR